MPPRLKRQPTHDKNNNAAGLAAPGRSKNVAKRKSNGALNQSSNGKSTPPLPSASHSDAATLDTRQSLPSPASDSPTATPDAKMGSVQSGPDGRDRITSGSSDDDLEAHGSANGILEHTAGGSPLKIDVKAAASKCAPAHQRNVFVAATTILKACPLWDVIAILIILLQLPPTIISVVQFLFAFLTFVSPTSGTSISNLPSINEVLLGASGAISLQTIILMDTLFLVPFLFLYTPVQNLALDLAQAVIAISLGGAVSTTGGTSGSILSCLVIIGLSHIVRFDFFRQLSVNLVWTALVKAGLSSGAAPPPLPSFADRLHASHSWPRKVVGVHIFAQGLTRIVRRWYLTNELASSKKNDLDSGSLSALSTPRTTSSFAEPNAADPAASASTDGRPPGPSPAAREKDTISSNKRKKKQANYVRSQQPFWAALANAKVTFLKELEHQQASSDAVEANAMDAGHIGNANFKSGKDRVWIKEVRPTEITFGLSLPSLMQEEVGEDGEVADCSGKRFSVRLNHTDWSSTKITEENLGIELGEAKVDVWSGKIFGLTASTQYICEFIRVDDGVSMFQTHITTQPAPFAEQAPAEQQQSLRPLSPTTTLRKSIGSAEQKLEAARNRLKRNKRDHKNVVTNLQKEVESLSARLSSNGGNDDRLKQKVRQLEQSIQQAKAKEAEITQQINDLSEIPAEEIQAANEKRAAWQQEKDRRTTAQKDLDSAKAEGQREVADLKAELSGLEQKRQKMVVKQDKFNTQKQKLLSEANHSQEAQSRRFQAREEEARTRSETERRYHEQIRLLDQDAQRWYISGQQSQARSKELEDLYNRNVQMQSMPTTPEGILPNSRSINQGIQHSNTFPSSLAPGFSFPNSSAPLLNDSPAMSGANPLMPGPRHSDPMSNQYREGRGRSSSMLSNISGLTDEIEDKPDAAHHIYNPYSQHQFGNGPTGFGGFSSAGAGAFGSYRDSRKSSQGSGAGSASTDSSGGSARDPMSPPPKTLSPLGKAMVSPISPPANAALR